MVKKTKTPECEICKAPFAPEVEWQKYCGKKCKGIAANRRRAKVLRQARAILQKGAA